MILLRPFLVATVFLVIFINVVKAQNNPLTFGSVYQILIGTPYTKVFNFVEQLNKDKTVSAKKARAKTFINNNFATHQFTAFDYYSNKENALKGIQNLIDHRQRVTVFWNDLRPRLAKVFNAATVNKYRKMWAKTDKVHDNAFFDGLNEWYTYCHYYSPTAKRTALYNAISKTTTQYANDTALNFDPMGGSFSLRFALSFLLGMW